MNTQEAINLINEAQGMVVSVGMNPDFSDLSYGDSPWLPSTLADASRLLFKAVKLLEEN